MLSMVPEAIIPYIEGVSQIISFLGIIQVVYAVFLTVYRVVRIEVLHEKRFHQYEHTKRVLIQKIILALDFFVAADLILLSIATELDEIFAIALIVAIRSILSWSLSREVHLHKE
ncbi:DUF1622 domain-containing protein [Candidatus Micrarchaeota archaeon]|nr:DUF1622 domain-containing protein [Candidatus Micrarchaeota archaeon]